MTHRTTNAFVAAQADRAGECVALEQCARSGQIDSKQLAAHVEAGEIVMFDEPKEQPLAQLQQEIADDHSRVVIETYCVKCPSDCPMPVWDTGSLENQWRDQDLEEADRREVERALRYLDMRALITRPIPGEQRFVSFKQEAV